MSNLAQSGVQALFSAVTSHAQSLGIFARVTNHEPMNTPGQKLSCVIVCAGITPVPRVSGMAATSGRVEFQVRVYNPFREDPQHLDDIDPDILTAVVTLLGAYSGDLTLENVPAGLVHAVDLLGISGAPLQAKAAYLQQDGKVFRVMDVVLPVICNDIWAQVVA